MNLTYPLEVYNEHDLVRGRGQEIGSARVLFPAFMPKTRSHVVKYFEPLNDRNKYMEATILRRGKVITLATPCLNYPLNQYVFSDELTDKQIVKYLKDNKGWKPSVRKNIEQSLLYSNSRRVIDDDLYRWEYENIPLVVVPFDFQEEIFYKEITERKISYACELTRYDHEESYGFCHLIRRSGWVSQPFKVVVGLNRKAPMYVVLHELAHLIAYFYYRSNIHSPIFLTIYNELLRKYMDLDFMPSMIENGLLQGMRNANQVKAKGDISKRKA